jgi:hypothetical protein
MLEAGALMLAGNGSRSDPTWEKGRRNTRITDRKEKGNEAQRINERLIHFKD